MCMAFVLSAKSRTRKTPHYRCDIQVRLIQNTELTVNDIARQERVSAAYIYALVRLPWLAPDITAAIVNGRQPPQLNAMKLMRLTTRRSLLNPITLR
jgi:hypothetical protein